MSLRAEALRRSVTLLWLNVTEMSILCHFMVSESLWQASVGNNRRWGWRPGYIGEVLGPGAQFLGLYKVVMNDEYDPGD
jgi:hypothetical protein